MYSHDGVLYNKNERAQQHRWTSHITNERPKRAFAMIPFTLSSNTAWMNLCAQDPGGWTATGGGTRGTGWRGWGQEGRIICFLICWLNKVFSLWKFIDLQTHDSAVFWKYLCQLRSGSASRGSEGEASLMMGGSTTALSLLSPITCILACAMLLPPGRE